MRKHQLSPSASILMSLALALGILVADIANVSRVTVAAAQTATGDSYVAVADATVVGTRIVALDVIVDGVPTSGVFVGSVQVVDSVLSTEPNVANGVNVGDSLTGGGVNVGDGATDEGGVNVGDGVTGVNVGDGFWGGDDGDSPTITGGTVEGDNVQVVDGVITGENLKVVGAYVSGSARSVVITSPTE